MDPFCFFRNWLLRILLTSAFLSPMLLRSQPVSSGTDTTLHLWAEAMWDLSFLYDIQDTLGTGALRGVTWFDQQFWVPTTQTDSIFILNNDGSLQQIVELSGADSSKGFTSLTHDGNLIYGVNLGDWISIIDPVTQTLSGQIALPPGTNAFFLTYDPGLDNGNGGFHIGTLSGNLISQYSLNGTWLSQFNTAALGINAVSGMVYDDISLGGPYLWTFSQAAVPSNAVISQLQLPGGTFSGIQRDVQPELNEPNPLAGDLFLIPQYAPLGIALLGGVAQGLSDQLFAYELDFQPVSIDVSLEACLPLPAVSQVPLSQVSAFQWEGKLFNLGTDTVMQGQLFLQIKDPAQALVYQDSLSWTSLLPTSSHTLSLGNWAPSSLGTYQIEMFHQTGSQVDSNPTNDSCTFQISLTDSVFARDNGWIEQALGIGPDSNDHAILGQNFLLNQTDFCTSISFALVRPPLGEQVSVSIYETLPNGQPSNLLGETVSYQIRAEDSQDTVWLTLPFPNAPLGLPPGRFFVGVNERGKKIQLGATSRLFATSHSWINWDSNPFGNWTRMEDLGFEVSFLLRPNFGPCSPSYLKGQLTVEQDDSGQGDARLRVQVSGGAPPYQYAWNDPAQQTTSVADQLPGGKAYQCLVTDQNGCNFLLQSDTIGIWTTGLFPDQAGLSFKVFPNPARQEVWIEGLLKQSQTIRLSLRTLQGQLVRQITLPPQTHSSYRMAIQGLSNGVYLLEATTQDTYWHTQLVIIAPN